MSTPETVELPKVLVVDDRPENLFALRRVLSRLPVELVEASSGNEALAHTLRHSFALILLDVQMPEMDGFEVASILREDPQTSSIPIIFVTAISKEERYIFKGYEAGAVDYLFKPVDPNMLRSKVNVFLDLDTHQRELSRTVAELKGTQEELKRSNQDLHDFAHIAAHDLKAPLRHVSHLVLWLEEDCGEDLNEEGLGYIEELRGAVGRMQTLISDLLSYSDAGGTREYERVDLNEVLDGVLLNLQGRIHESEGAVEVGDLPEIDADVSLLRQVFQNLIGNALKYFREGVPPQISLQCTTYPGRNRCVMLLKDNGIGFSNEHAEQMFKPFKRLATQKKFEGTGIGLAIVKKVIERHGGSIVAKGEPGVGATFTIEFPLRQLT